MGELLKTMGNRWNWNRAEFRAVADSGFRGCTGLLMFGEAEFRWVIPSGSLSNFLASVCIGAAIQMCVPFIGAYWIGQACIWS
jgi:hypothetical protein